MNTFQNIICYRSATRIVGTSGCWTVAWYALLIAAAVHMTAPRAYAQAEYIDLPMPPGATQALAYAVSADGSTVVGAFWRPNNTIGAWRWSSANGIEVLGSTLSNLVEDRAYAVNEDGSVIVGGVYQDSCPTGSNLSMAARWTTGTNAELIPDVDPELCSSFAFYVSDDGSVIGGASIGGGPSVWWYVPSIRVNDGLWTSVGGSTGCPPANDFVRGGSPDGRYIVGGPVFDGLFDAWIYDRVTENLTVIDDLPPNDPNPCGHETRWAIAYDVNNCGDRVVGTGMSGGTVNANTIFEAIFWTPASGTVGLGDFVSPVVLSSARAIHPEKFLIVGRGSDPNAPVLEVAAVWESNLQIQRLKDWAIARGATIPADRHLRNAFDIRQVGERVFICGSALNTSTGVISAFLLKVPYDPCPADIACAFGDINVSDLFMLLSNWNTAGAGADLAPPLNVVDVADLFVLLASWGPCF